MSLRELFGKRLVEIRLSRGITQASLAEKIGVTVEFVSLIERGINAPSFDTLERLSGELDVQVYEFFYFKE